MHLHNVVQKELGVQECPKVHGTQCMHLYGVFWKVPGVQECNMSEKFDFNVIVTPIACASTRRV